MRLHACCCVDIDNSSQRTLVSENNTKYYYVNVKQTRGTQIKLLFSETLKQRKQGEHIRRLLQLTVIRSMATGSTPTGRCHESIHISQYEYLHHIRRVNIHALTCTVMSLGRYSQARHKRNYGMCSTSYNSICVICTVRR